jgi:hypothetical protein
MVLHSERSEENIHLLSSNVFSLKHILKGSSPNGNSRVLVMLIQVLLAKPTSSMAVFIILLLAINTFMVPVKRPI